VQKSVFGKLSRSRKSFLTKIEQLSWELGWVITFIL